MTKDAILFGSIGTLVETSDLQRQAFNVAFEDAGLEWTWGPETYQELLRASGGRQRIETYARKRGENVDATALHARKTEVFDAWMVERGLGLRPGVARVLERAQDDSLKLAFVTTTSRANIDAIFAALGAGLGPDRFDFIGEVSLVASGKPSPEIYEIAIRQLGVNATGCVAIEDTPVSARAAQSAGIETVAFPGEYADREGFAATGAMTDALDYRVLTGRC